MFPWQLILLGWSVVVGVGLLVAIGAVLAWNSLIRHQPDRYLLKLITDLKTLAADFEVQIETLDSSRETFKQETDQLITQIQALPERSKPEKTKAKQASKQVRITPRDVGSALQEQRALAEQQRSELEQLAQRIAALLEAA